MFVFVIALTTLIGIFGFSEIVAPVARGAVLLIPAIFAISVVVGFAFRKQHWLH